ncbi:MAG: CHAT domain-containing tetratricopeptide repeat protein, partial [Ginsengibacter sp.]
MKILFFLLSFLSASAAYSQSGRPVIDHLENLVNEKKFQELEIISAKSIAKFRKQNNIDSLIVYAWYESKAIANLKSLPAAESRFISIIENDIVNKNATGDEIVYAYLMAANLMVYEGDSKRGYAILKKLSDNASLKEKIKHLKYRIESNMGLSSMRLGLYAISSNHYRQSLKLFPPEEVKSEEYFGALNSMGIAMYQSAKLDSSIYYFKLASDFLNDLGDSPINKFYRSGILDANIGNVLSEQGETNKSNEYAERAIEKYRKFLMTDTNFPQKNSAHRNLLFCIDNLATTLLESGDYLKAKNLYSYALSEKQKLLGENDPEVYASYIALAGVSLSREETGNAINYAEKALVIIRKIGDTLTLYDADAYSKLAQAWYKKGDVEKASSYFLKAYKILDHINGDDISTQYLDFLNKYALFKARVNDGLNAEILSRKSLNYALKTNHQYSLPVALQLLNLMKVQLQLKKYKTSLDYSEKAIATFNKLIGNAATAEDSIRFENFKASAIFGKSKSAYYLLTEKNQNNLRNILNQLEETSSMFERRKLYYPDEENVSLTIESYKEINGFISLLQLELYRITKDRSYLDAVIQRNESLVYTRLKRSLNNRNLNVHFRDVPASIQIKEAEIKALLEDALKRNKSETGSVNNYFKKSKKWVDFLLMLKKDFPAYYQARYGSEPEKNIDDYKQVVPVGSQVVRFYIINENIYALVLSQTEDHWIALSAKDLSGTLLKLQRQPSLEATGFLTYDLYQKLWKPIEPFIHEKKITIIPDGIIYNISFDMLTTKPIKNARDLIAFSLLNKYAFSYQYSLDVFNQKKSARQRYSGVSAFAPAFSDSEKQDYIRALKRDSLQIDKSYLTLLPLPFSRDLAGKLESFFGSTVFIGNESTVSNFEKNAGNHSIIYIGTHAESNNQFPEYSRMFFAKDLNAPTADNSLYLYDIYDQNLNADLAVLTACETGQSNFFPGEGMISMAHAFNYAGSESVLTSLWKIDEYASIVITETFYKNLEKGMTKDVALQQAK